MEDPDADGELTRRYYDRISRVYDVLTDASEHAIRSCGIEALALRAGERALEIGFGTGHGLVAMARAIGVAGLVCGVDVSAGMAAIAGARVDREVRCRVRLVLGDGRALCFPARTFDAVFLSFTLERFGPEIPLVLSEARRVLRPGGRIGVVAMDATMGPGAASPVYQWLHQEFPHAIDCTPIDVVGVLAAAGFSVEVVQATRIWTLPVKAAIGRAFDDDVD
jgi:demethylmenaquinone methyltransferase/2-methoxy-6-polyprenyl-1,4-benzoquinol methylase